MENKSNQARSMFEDGKMCRLCLQLITGAESQSVDDVELFKLKMSDSVATDPGICSECLNWVPVRSNFIKQEKEEISETKIGDIYLIDPCVKMEEMEIKQEEPYEEPIPVTIPYHEIKEDDEAGNIHLHLPNTLIYTKTGSDCNFDKNNININYQDSVESRESKQYNFSETRMYACYNTGCECKQLSRLVHMDTAEVRIYKCDECQFETECSYGMKSHQLTHEETYAYDMYDYETHDKDNRLVHRKPLEVQMYKCDECSFETKHRGNLKVHQLKHKDPSEVQMHKCTECDYESKYKEYLKSHMLIHKDPSEVQMHKCEECDYECKHKDYLKSHMLIHKDRSEVQMYKCEKCEYETKHKRYLKTHMLIHKDPSEVQMHKCSRCEYETNKKANLKVHILKHKDPSEVEMYKCDQCKYETKHKKYLKRHILVHEVQKYKCDHCSSEFKAKAYLVKHQKNHKNPSEAQMYKCDHCGCEFKVKRYLVKHQMTHKNLSEVQ